MFLEQRGLRLVAKDWKTDGKFGATSDLGNAYVYLMPNDFLYGQQWKPDQMLGHLRPLWMRIHVANLTIDLHHFTRVGTSPIYVARLPNQTTILSGTAVVAEPDVDDKALHD